MKPPIIPSITKERLKEQAKALKALKDIKSTHAHEIVAKSYGYKSYNHFLAAIDAALDWN